MEKKKEGKNGYFAKLQQLILKVKARLATELGEILKRKALSQRKAAEKLGISQPDISHLKNGDPKGFSLDRLLQFFGVLGLQVVLKIRKAPSANSPPIKLEKF
jgi:predicted XRE-type DNA-binding protein